MKQKTKNTLHLIAYILITITGASFIGNKVLDIMDELKVNTDLEDFPKAEYKANNIKTTYPDKPIDDFNSWSEQLFLNKQ